ncbi:hypothetical protein ACSQ67_008862 [Phaseolus vulgaris]
MLGFFTREVSWEDVREEMFSGVVGIKAQCMGDDCVLLTPENETKPRKMVEENRGGLEKLFQEIVEWSDAIVPWKKQVWLRFEDLDVNSDERGFLRRQARSPTTPMRARDKAKNTW